MTEREQVVAAAQAVMGWTVVGFSDDDRAEGVYPRLIENIEREWVLVTEKGGTPTRWGVRSWQSWNPTRSISDAWMLLDRIVQLGGGVQVCMAPGPNPWVEVTMLDENRQVTHVKAEATTVPAAITVAALRAAGVAA